MVSRSGPQLLDPITSARTHAQGAGVQGFVERHLAVVQNAWRALLGVTLGLFVAAVPPRVEQLEAVSRQALRDHSQLLEREVPHFLRVLASPEVYPRLVVALEISFVLALVVASAGIAWGNLSDWRNMFFCAVFITYAVWVTPTVDALDGGPLFLNFVSLVQATGLILAIHFFLMFPDGKLCPWWTRYSSAFWIVYTLAWGIYPDAWFSLIDPFEVPVGVFLALMFGWVTGLVAQAARYRSQASPEQRVQTKWVIVAVGAAVAGYGTVYVPGLFIAETGTSRVLFDLFNVPVFWVLAIPMAFALGGAMLRHHLFDFHGVVNKTLVYGFLTTTLALVYFGMVTLLQQVVHPVAGKSNLAVAASTLMVAVLFVPVRSRIQSQIDRRFYRSQYDANRALESFSRRLRDQTELGSVEQELLATIVGTMQPRQASLWLAQPLEPPRGQAQQAPILERPGSEPPEAATGSARPA